MLMKLKFSKAITTTHLEQNLTKSSKMVKLQVLKTHQYFLEISLCWPENSFFH